MLKRKQRWYLMAFSLLLLIVMSATVIALGIVIGERPVYLVSLGILIILFCSYIIESEIRLAQVEQRLLEEEFRTLEEQAKQVAMRLTAQRGHGSPSNSTRHNL